jgi:hypothetical protein
MAVEAALHHTLAGLLGTEIGTRCWRSTFFASLSRNYTALDHSGGTLHLSPAEGTNCKGSLTALDTHAHAARDPRRRRKLCTNAVGDLAKALHCSSVRQNTIDADLLEHFTSSLRAFVSEVQTAAPC